MYNMKVFKVTVTAPDLNIMEDGFLINSENKVQCKKWVALMLDKKFSILSINELSISIDIENSGINE